MAFNLQTPQKQLPGAYIQTPAQGKLQSGQIVSNFRSNSAPSYSQHGFQAPSQAHTSPSQTVAEVGKPSAQTLKPLERAAKTINETLAKENAYPELDSYLGRKFFVLLWLVNLS